VKLTKLQLKQIIKEELSKVLSEQPWEVGHEPVTSDEEADRNEAAAARHLKRAAELLRQASGHTTPGDAGDDYTEKGHELAAAAERSEEQAAIVQGIADQLRSGEPGRQERGYGKHLEEIIKEELKKVLEVYEDPEFGTGAALEDPDADCGELKAKLDAAVEREAELITGDWRTGFAEAEIRELSKEYGEKCGS
jgi:hypothetical protein